MPVKTPLFRRVTIVGVGLIGGSLGMAIKKHNLAREVVGVSQRNSSMVHALKNKAIDHAFNDIKQAVHNTDFIILAAPVKSIISLFSSIAPHVRRNCIITDVGSTKISIVEAAERDLPSPAFFVGSHPLAGSEKKGAYYANAELFEGATCVMTPTATTNRLAKDKVKHFWTQLGANVKTLTPEEHDRILAYISHLPHLVAYGLMGSIPQDLLEYAGQGLRDTTRIAASTPTMWNDICMANSKNIITSLDELIERISSIRKSIIAKDEQELISQLEKAKQRRDTIDKND